jgi:chromosome segregation ATPase
MSNTFEMDGHENMVLIDKNVVDSIICRLESLEKRSSNSTSSASGPEMTLMKQQLENIKQAVMKMNTNTNGLIKENKDLKSQVSDLKAELNDAKELLQALQNLTMDNSQKLLGLAGEPFGNIDELGEGNDLAEINDDFGSVGTNLKELIENEINGNM